MATGCVGRRYQISAPIAARPRYGNYRIGTQRRDTSASITVSPSQLDVQSTIPSPIFR